MCIFRYTQLGCYAFFHCLRSVILVAYNFCLFCHLLKVLTVISQVPIKSIIISYYLLFAAALDKPHFGVHPTNMIVPEHLAAILQCQILGVPSPVVSWTFNGQPVNDISDRYILSNGSLYFAPPVNRSYAGQYVCSGQNSAGSVSSGAVLFRVACK